MTKKYRIGKEENTFKVYCYVDNSKSVPKVLSPFEYERLKNKKEEKLEKEWCEFKRLSWKEENEIRRNAITRDMMTGNSYIDLIKLREEKFRKLFVNWSLILEDENKKEIKITSDDENKLSDKSFNIIVNSPILKPFIETFLNEADRTWEFSEEPMTEEEKEKEEQGQKKENQSLMKSENGQQ